MFNCDTQSQNFHNAMQKENIDYKPGSIISNNTSNILFMQVYGYRMSLWAEHLGMLDGSFKEPESLECVKKVNGIAEDNWRRFTSEEFTLLQGHLLKYPLQVDADGKVSLLPQQENFPDVGGKVLGVHSATIPDLLTT